MPRWNTTTIIAGADFSMCRATIVDPGNVATNYVGSSAPAADGTPHVQRVNTGKSKGRKYGVNLPVAEATLLQQALAAIEAAEASGTPFRVQMEDAVTSIDDDVWPDYSAGQWFQRGAESEGQVEEVTLRFEAVGPHT